MYSPQHDRDTEGLYMCCCFLETGGAINQITRDRETYWQCPSPSTALPVKTNSVIRLKALRKCPTLNNTAEGPKGQELKFL